MTVRRHGVASHTTKPPQAAQDDKARSAILVAARGLIQRYGFRKTTMDDIARAVGKERTSLYYYFPGKKEVMKALIEHEFAEISQAVREEVAHQGDAAGRGLELDLLMNPGQSDNLKSRLDVACDVFIRGLQR